MALTVAPAAGYDSFVSREDADAYFTEQGYAAWAAATVGVREDALRKGTVFVTSKRLLPSAISPAVHANVERATMEAAKLVLMGVLYRSTGSSSQQVTEKTVGPLTIRYAANAEAASTTFPLIDDLLFGLTYGYGTSVFFERA